MLHAFDAAEHKCTSHNIKLTSALANKRDSSSLPTKIFTPLVLDEETPTMDSRV